MAAIGAIRKHGVLLMAIIGIALLAFLLGDFTHLTSLFSDKYTMVKVDGDKMDDTYRLQYEQNTALWKMFYKKQSLDETEMYQIHEMTWNQMIEDALLDKELEKLGLVYTDEMIENNAADMLASLRTQQPNQMLYQMVSILAEQYGVDNAISIISSIEDYKDNEQAADIYNAYKAIERFSISDKKRMSFFALAQNTLYFSDPMAEKLVEDNQTALSQLLAINPNAQAFKEINPTVSEKEMKSWFKEHKEQYKVKQDNCDIDVAVFPINPTPEDLQTIEDSVKLLYQRFVAAPSIAAFNLAEMFGPVDSNYYTKEDVNLDILDSLIFNRPVGTNIEPFMYENAVWYYGKTYNAASRSDSVLVVYLVMDYKTAQNPNSTRTMEQAKNEADSIQQLINSGQSSAFALLPNYLAGRAATDTVMWVPERGTIPSLYDTFLKTTNGGTYLHEATSAYVIYQVLSKTAPIEKRQFVIYPYEIKPSDATVKAIKLNATQLAAEAVNADELVDAANAKGVQLVRGYNVGSMSSSVSQLPNCRDIVSWAFAKETKKDAISDVVNVDGKFYAVAAVRDKRKVGYPKFEEVKSIVENEMMQLKKVEMVQKAVSEEVAKGTSMAELSIKYSAQLRDSVRLAFAGQPNQNYNVENIAIARIFNKPEMGKTTVVAGKTAVYAVNLYSVDKQQASPNFTVEKQMLRNMVVGNARNESVLLQGLKDNASILDQRHLFYAQ